MIELLGSKAAVCSGKFHYGTAFGEPSNLADKVRAQLYILGLRVTYLGLVGCGHLGASCLRGRQHADAGRGDRAREELSS